VRRRTGRVCCGICNVVLGEPHRRRTPTRGEQAQYEAMVPGTERGRFLYRISHSQDRLDSHQVYMRDSGERVEHFHCDRCHVTYEPDDFAQRLDAAEGRGESLILTENDRI